MNYDTYDLCTIAIFDLQQLLRVIEHSRTFQLWRPGGVCAQRHNFLLGI